MTTDDDLDNQDSEEYGDEETDPQEQPPYHESVTQNASYENEGAKLTNDVARDESLQELIFFTTALAKLTRPVQARVAAMAACYLSKNYVFSNIVNPTDMIQVQDDFEYVKLVSKVGVTTFDRNMDYLTAVGLIESNLNVRLRRSRDALGLKSLSTSTVHNIDEQRIGKEESKMRSKFGFLNNLMGGG